MSNLKFPAVVVLGVVAVLVSAGAVFGLRSWVGTDPDSDLGASPTASATPTDEPTVEPTTIPSDDPAVKPAKTPKPKPSASATPSPSPTPTKDKPTPKPSKTPAAPTAISTTYIERVIGQRLAATTGDPVSVGCPGSVSAKVGTSFSCGVRIQSSPAKTTSASVVIVGTKGQFKWSSGSAQ